MTHYFPIFFLALLVGCGREPPDLHIPPDLLREVPGWRGPTPTTEGAFARAALAEKYGREQANAQIKSIDLIYAKYLAQRDGQGTE